MAGEAAVAQKAEAAGVMVVAAEEMALLALTAAFLVNTACQAQAAPSQSTTRGRSALLSTIGLQAAR